MATERFEAKWMNEFENKFGGPEDNFVVMGDWKQTNFKPQAPRKNVGYRKTFKKRNCRLLLLDEYRTSCRCHTCVLERKEGENTKKHRVPNPRPYRRAKTPTVLRHGSLTCKKCGCLWNRNVNVVLNMIHVVDEYIKGNESLDLFHFYIHKKSQLVTTI
ncbi:hypothetical protein P9112_012323 [Eukaryota sp. TZLM1-RC]